MNNDERRSDRRLKKRSKKSKKKHSKSHKKEKSHLIQGYILQVIGILCLILAAVKSFEPLTGVGFTLVLVGCNENSRKKRRSGQCHEIKFFDMETIKMLILARSP